MSQLHQQLTETLLKLRQLKKVQLHYTSQKSRLQEENKKLVKLEKALKKEERDVEKLEKSSMRGLFHKILGNKEEQLEKERQEYLAAALKFNELNKSIELIAYEIEVLEKKLADFESTEKKAEQLLKMREQELLRTNPIVGQELLLIHRKIDESHVVLKDIDEARVVGEEAHRILRKMEKELRNARNWGQWDMAGDRHRASYAKHRAIDRARDLSYRAKHVLLKFRDELRDVYQDVHFDVHIALEGMNRFTDIFFDNLISDWIVQQKIKNALTNVIHVKKQVDTALAQMADEAPRIKEKLADLEERRRTTILQSQ